MKKSLSPKTNAALSALIAGGAIVATPAHAEESTTNQGIEESVDFSEVQNLLEEFVLELQADSDLLGLYLENPEVVLRDYGFSSLMIREILREDGFLFQSPNSDLFDGCWLTCACTGCCATCGVTSGNSDSGNSNTGGSGSGGGGGGGRVRGGPDRTGI